MAIYRIYREGELVSVKESDSDICIFEYIHNNTSYSVSYAQKWQGFKYTIQEEGEEEKLLILN